MGMIKLDGLPVEQPAAEPWPPLSDNGDEYTIRVDEMFARQLDNAFAGHVRGLLHDPETGVAARTGEVALEAIAAALPALDELKNRTLSQAVGPRQRSMLEPLIDTRLDRAAGTLGRLAHRATVEVDDASVADRIAGLKQDAATAWQDPAYLHQLGRTAVDELRYQGERHGWDPAETDARVRTGLSDLYVGAVETAIDQNDLDGAAALYDHARPVIDPERQTVVDRRFVGAREAALYRDVDRDLAGIPIEPAGPPGAEVFAERAAELTPEDANDEVCARIGQVANFAQRRAERQWEKQQSEAGVAALDWIGKNPEASVVTLPPDIRDWLAPDQWRGLEALQVEGRLKTNGDLFERLDRQMVYEPDRFAALDLDRYRLSLDHEDRARFASAQKAIADGRLDPRYVRYDWLRRGIDRTLKTQGIDSDGPDAVQVRADARDRLKSFETIEGRVPVVGDLDDIARRAIDTVVPQDAWTGSDENIPAEDRSSTPDIPLDEERLPSPADNNVHQVSAHPAMPDAMSAEGGTMPPYAADPNIIRVAGGGNSSRRGGGGRSVTPIEEMRRANFQSTLKALRELEPNNRELTYVAPRDWVPREHDVARVQEELSRARARAAGETSAVPIGEYAGESISAGSPGRRVTSEERREVDRIGSEQGCHSCGATGSGTLLKRWVPDHQPPTALIRQGQAQRLYPQCISCSRRQGGEVNNLKRERNRE